MKLILKTLAISTLAIAAFGAEQKAYFTTDFDFHIGNKVMPAGDYAIKAESLSSHIMQVYNRAGKHQALITLPVSSELSPGDERASLQFLCGTDGCEIASVKNLRQGFGSNAWNSKKPNMKLISVALRSELRAGE